MRYGTQGAGDGSLTSPSGGRWSAFPSDHLLVVLDGQEHPESCAYLSLDHGDVCRALSLIERAERDLTPDRLLLSDDGDPVRVPGFHARNVWAQGVSEDAGAFASATVSAVLGDRSVRIDPGLLRRASIEPDFVLSTHLHANATRAFWRLEPSHSEPYPGSATLSKRDLLLARLRVAPASDADAAFRDLAAQHPSTAAMVGLNGVPCRIGRPSPRDVASLVSRSSLTPLLRHEDATVRERVLEVLGRTDRNSPPARPPSSPRRD